MLASATSNCGVTSVTYNDNRYYVVTWTVCLESSMYSTCADARRKWQRHQIAVMRHIACWFRSGAVLKFDQLLSYIIQASKLNQA